MGPAFHAPDAIVVRDLRCRQSPGFEAIELAAHASLRGARRRRPAARPTSTALFIAQPQDTLAGLTSANTRISPRSRTTIAAADRPSC